jgi:hypothetical protein
MANPARIFQEADGGGVISSKNAKIFPGGRTAGWPLPAEMSASLTTCLGNGIYLFVSQYVLMPIEICQKNVMKIDIFGNISGGRPQS